MRDLRFSEGLVLAPLLFLIVFLGIYPKVMLDRIEPSVKKLVEHVDREVDGFTVKAIVRPKVPAAAAEGSTEGEG
jgi:NADH-quinone oxidoreductase subunit M